MNATARDLARAHPDLHRGGDRAAPSTSPRFQLDQLGGRFVEVSSHGETAALTVASSLLAQAQRQGEPTAWITIGGSTFYPPDLADAGIDLAALPVVCLGDAKAAARAADHLIRSGAFGLAVLDLGVHVELHPSIQTRLCSLAHRHHTTLLCLTRKQERSPSLGSLVSLRAEAGLLKLDFDRFQCRVRVLKDKKQGPGWEHVEVVRGAEGLC